MFKLQDAAKVALIWKERPEMTRERWSVAMVNGEISSLENILLFYATIDLSDSCIPVGHVLSRVIFSFSCLQINPRHNTAKNDFNDFDFTWLSNP